tara:strand:+ start:1525 stop:5118 length:3594 start_codon:yes stop_codon:yes gene_type:complete
MVGIPGGTGANKGAWATQLRDRYGKFAPEGKAVLFEFSLPGGGTGKVRAFFRRMIDMDTAELEVMDNSEIPKGSYQIDRKFIEVDQRIATLPSATEKQESAAAPELKTSMTGDEAIKIRMKSVTKALKGEGRFPIPRQFDNSHVGKDSDVAKGAKLDYKKVFDSEPALQKKYGSAENMWTKVLEYSVDNKSQSPNTLAEIPEDMKELNRAYAKHVLGLDPDGTITFYRNAINNKDTPEESAIGYASLDKTMAYDYNPQMGNAGANGRYEIDVKPDELSGMIGYSKVEDEYGIVLGREMTNIQNRVRRVGDLEKSKTAPWLESSADVFRENPGSSPFRYFTIMSQYEMHPVESFGEDINEFFSKYSLSAVDIKSKYDELYGEGAYDEYKASGNTVSFQNIKGLFVDLGEGKVGLDGVKLSLMSEQHQTDAEYKNDRYDNTMKMLSVFQELTGQYFMTHKTRQYDAPDANVSKADNIGGQDGERRNIEEQRSTGPEGQGTVPTDLGPEGGPDDGRTDSDSDSPWSSLGNPLEQSDRVKELAARGKKTPDVYELDPEKDAPAFIAAMEKLKENNVHSASVYIYGEEEYRQMRLFATADGTAGFALKGGNEIVSVYVHSDSEHKGASRSLIARAVSLGGDRLDAFDTALPHIYAQEGFAPVSRVKWDDEYAPDGWDHELYKEFNGGRPDVVVMAYDPSRIGEDYNPEEGQYFDGYDEAIAARDRSIHIKTIAAELAKTYNIKDFKRTGEQLGSNPGGTFTGPDGTKYYAKTPRSGAHMENELLASGFYQLAGIPAAKMRYGDDGTTDGKIFSEIISGQTLANTSLSPETKKQIQDGFVIDAWLANWDVAGLGDDNIIINDEGEAFRIDVGGSLLFRAQGGDKGDKFSDEVTEIDTLRDSNRNPRSGALFGSMTDEELKASASKLLGISPQDIDTLVDAAFYGEVGDELKRKLKARRDNILKRFNLQQTEVSMENSPNSTPEAESKDVVAPGFENWAPLLADVLALTADSESEDNNFDPELGNKRLSTVMEKAGYNAKPKLVSAEEFDSIEGGTLYRGIDAEGAVDQYKNSPKHFAGKGKFGNGTYSTDKKETAVFYGTSDESNVLEMKLSADANVQKFDSRKDYMAWVDETMDKFREDYLNSGVSNDEYYDYIRQMDNIVDWTNVAVMLGIDAIEFPHGIADAERYTIILNRGKVIINDKS